MPQMTYTVELDTLRDYTYGASIDAITDKIVQADWSFGMSMPYEEIALTPATMSLMLSNAAAHFHQETLGSELLTNGNFATWSSDNPSSWTVAGESGSNPEISQVASNQSHDGSGTGACNIYSTGSTVSIAQTVLTVGQTYYAQLSITNNASGAIAMYNGSTRVSPIYHLSGVYGVFFNATATSFKIQNMGSETCNITIDDVSVKQTALYSGLLRPGTMIRIKGTYSATTKVLFEGKIPRSGIHYGIAPMSGEISGRSVNITAQDAMLQLLDAEYNPPLLLDATVDEAMQDMFDEGVVRWPYANSWVLEAQGNSELGLTTTLYDHAVTNFDTGMSEIAFIGDAADRGQGVSAQGYIQDLAAAEMGGRFFYNPRDGQFIFHDRHRDIQNDTSLATYASDIFSAIDYVYGDDVLNDVTINYTYREVGEPGTVLWSLPSVPFRIRAQSSRSFSARYVDLDNPEKNIGAQDIIPITAPFDIIAREGESPSSTVANITVSGELQATKARVTVVNSSSVDLYIHTLQIRGTPLVWYEDSVRAVDGTSSVQNDLYPRVVEIRLASDVNLVQAYADLLVRRHANPVAYIRSVTFEATQTATTIAAALNRTIGDRITITDAYTGHSSDYIIVGEGHSVKSGTGSHLTTWRTKPAILRGTFWELGTTTKSELGTTTRLIF